jgi:protein-disulfide isomerase
MWRIRLRRIGCLALLAVLGFTQVPGIGALGVINAALGARQLPPALVVSEGVPDEASGTLTIKGAGFGARPFVTLNLIPLTIQFALDGQILASAPIRLMPPGTYLLTVSRGPLPTDSASIDVTLGGAAPSPAQPAGRPAANAPATEKPPAAKPGAPAPGFGSPADVIAKVGDRAITTADVDREWQRIDPASYVGVGRRIHEMRRRMADQLIADELLARESAGRGLSTEALLAEEIPKRTVPLPDSAVLSLYQQLGDDTRGASLDQMRPALRAWLARFTEPEIARMNYIEELMRVSTRVDVSLAPPRIDVQSSTTDAPLGPAAAVVQIVVFGDLRNGRYALYAQSFARIRETFGDRVRLVFKPLPSDDPESLAAAEAAQCAHAQGKFWPFHDAVISQSGPLGPSRIGTLAADLGLDRAAFDACRDGERFRRPIFAAIDEARRYDIQTSPSFLVNGRLAPVPPPFLPPFEFFTRLIEEELLALKQK